MRVAALLILVRGATLLWTSYSGKIIGNRLCNFAFDNIPEIDLYMCALNGAPQCGHTGISRSVRKIRPAYFFSSAEYATMFN